MQGVFKALPGIQGKLLITTDPTPYSTFTDLCVRRARFTLSSSLKVSFKLCLKQENFFKQIFLRQGLMCAKLAQHLREPRMTLNFCLHKGWD